MLWARTTKETCRNLNIETLCTLFGCICYSAYIIDGFKYVCSSLDQYLRIKHTTRLSTKWDAADDYQPFKYVSNFQKYIQNKMERYRIKSGGEYKKINVSDHTLITADSSQ